jgi:hypothetical protein
MWSKSQQEFLDRALPYFRQDPRLLGVTGSRVAHEEEEFSDLELCLVCQPEAFESFVAEGKNLVNGLGSRLVGFEEGEPHHLVSLFDDPLLHVDLRIVSLNDFFNHPPGEQEILWEKENALSQGIKESRAAPSHPDLQWIEDRFWVWLHYGAERLRRGEIFETIHLLDFLRTQALGPLIHWRQGLSSRGVRQLEKYGGESLSALRATVPIYDARSCELSLKEAAKLYVDLRENLANPSLIRHRRTEMACMRYLHEVNDDLKLNFH